MKTKNIFKYSAIYCLILVIISLGFSYSLNKTIETHFNNGLLEKIVVEKNKDYTLTYYYNDIEMESYPSYYAGMQSQIYGQLLYADNGLVYNRQTPMGVQSFVIDYSWLPSGEYSKDGIKHYLKQHRLVMLLRTTYLSTGWSYMALMCILLLFISKLILPTIIFMLSNIFSYFKYRSIPEYNASTDRLKYYELYRSLIMTKTLNRYSKSRDFIIFTCIYSYLVVYLLILNNSVSYFIQYLPTLSLIFIGLSTIFCLYYITQVVTDNENKLLLKELTKKLNIRYNEKDT